jgi:hypothetical protein
VNFIHINWLTILSHLFSIFLGGFIVWRLIGARVKAWQIKYENLLRDAILIAENNKLMIEELHNIARAKEILRAIIAPPEDSTEQINIFSDKNYKN